MIIDRLEMRETGEQILDHADKPFPHTAFYTEPGAFPGGFVPWHWHADVELLYVSQGKVELRTNQGEYTLSAGDALFINANVLHIIKPCPGGKAITLAQVFDAGLISGGYKSIFAQKYVEPLLSCREIDVMLFRQNDVRQRKIIDYIKLSQDAAEEQAYGYELQVRNYLSSMWLLLCQEAEKQMTVKKVTKASGEDRLKRMMRYIQAHYMEKVLLEDIARSASISQREALRTFRANLNMTPFAYLMEYRLRMATVQLTQTANPVSQIAYDCGFSSPSYFGKEFRKAMGLTPLEYRKKSHAAGLSESGVEK